MHAWRGDGSRATHALRTVQVRLLLELLIVALDAPAQLGDVDQPCGRESFGRVESQLFGLLICALGPLDQQPLFRRLSVSL